MKLTDIFPIVGWIKTYSRQDFSDDLVASIIVTIMLIPQSMAYAMLAGLPPVVGLYASILPLMAYALFGSSRVLAVGPVAVISLMTASAIQSLGYTALEDQIAAAITLSVLSGGFLLLLGMLRLGILANLLSHPVISSFITASAILIAISQMKHILGLEITSTDLGGILTDMAAQAGETNFTTAMIGGGAILFLYVVRLKAKDLLVKMGIRGNMVNIIARSCPILAVAGSILIVGFYDLGGEAGVKTIGALPTSLPPLALPDLSLWQDLLPSAVIISIVGFVESVSVAQSLANLKRQRINSNQELVALGAANVAAGLSGGYPVTGGFARSVVNYDAGASSPLAGALTAVFIGLTTLYLTPLFFYLPQAVLAATIIVAVLSLVDFKTFLHTWQYRKADGIASVLTFILVLVMGVEAGIIVGVLSSMLLHIWQTTRPHMAIVGLVPGTEHFRNIERHEVATDPCLITIRIDESLYFANTRYLENKISEIIAEKSDLGHVVLMCSAVNEIDTSALESLESIVDQLQMRGITLHLSEVKGPVLDRLKRTDFFDHLTGSVFLSQYEALAQLCPRLIGNRKEGQAGKEGQGPALLPEPEYTI